MRPPIGLSCVFAACVACGGDGMTFIDAPAGADADVEPDASAPDADVELDAASPDALAVDAAVTLTSTVSFMPGVGSLCGIGVDPIDDRVWVYPCSGATLHAFTPAGVADGTLARPGEAANDVDVAFAPEAATIGAASVAAGDMLFVNGETGVAEVHLPETAAATALVTTFGASHVVGGGYHPGRDTLFLVQDRVPVTGGNTIAEVDRVTGSVITSFSTLPAFDVNYGDLEVCATTGHLFLVSDVEATIAELSPTGALIAEHALPAAVMAPSGIALTHDGAAWIAGTGGGVWRVDGVPCAPAL